MGKIPNLVTCFTIAALTAGCGSAKHNEQDFKFQKTFEIEKGREVTFIGISSDIVLKSNDSTVLNLDCKSSDYIDSDDEFVIFDGVNYAYCYFSIKIEGGAANHYEFEVLVGEPQFEPESSVMGQFLSK